MTYGRHPNHETVPCYHNITSFNWITFIASVGLDGRTDRCVRTKNEKYIAIFQRFYCVFHCFTQLYSRSPRKTTFIFRTLTRPGFIGCTFCFIYQNCYTLSDKTLSAKMFVSQNFPHLSFRQLCPPKFCLICLIYKVVQKEKVAMYTNQIL